MFDVFISYSHADEDIAFALCDFLESDGQIKCWIAPRNVRGGKRYSAEIIEGIRESPVFLLLFSSSSDKSKHVISELDIAFNAEKTIIPFCLENAVMSEDFSYYLAAIHRITGYPSPSDRFEELKKQILLNIPGFDAQTAKVPETKGDVEDKPKRDFEEFLSSFVGKETKKDERSRYDILQNDRGEILFIISERKGPAVSPMLVIDSHSPCALLYRSHESSVFFDDIAENAKLALLNVGEIHVCETTDDDVIREYKAPVRVVNNVRALMD